MEGFQDFRIRQWDDGLLVLVGLRPDVRTGPAEKATEAGTIPVLDLRCNPGKAGKEEVEVVTKNDSGRFLL